MAFVAQNHSPDLICWLLYAANLIWTVAYDTQYRWLIGMMIKIGVKSTAILFGRFDLIIISLLQGLFILLALIGYLQTLWFNLGNYFGRLCICLFAISLLQ